MEKDGETIHFGFEIDSWAKERKADYAYSLFNTRRNKPDLERDIMESAHCVGLFAEPSGNLTEDRVRELVREELLEFKLQYLRADTLFQRILQEIRREKSGKSPRKR